MTHSHILTGGAAMALAITGLGLGTGIDAAKAADFYKGKRLILTASASPGGGFDRYTRLLSRHIVNHIPGKPRAIVKNRTGASGMVLTNYTYNVAPKDGTFIGNVRSTAIKEAIFGNKRSRIDGRKFEYNGNLNSETSSCVFWHTSGAISLKDFYNKPLIMGASGRGGESYSYPALFNSLFDTKFKMILGYRASGLRMLAMERGEIHGECGSYTSILKFQRAKQIKSGKLRVLVLASNKADPDFAHVPNMLDQTDDPEKRKIMAFMFGPLEIARMFAAPPGTPKDRVKILRAGFDAAVKDPAFLADAKRGKLNLDPSSAAEVEKVVARLYSATPGMIKRIKKALAGKVAKRKLVYYTHTTKITKTKRKGARIYFKDRDGRKAQASVSGKRTKITVNGKKAKKSKIKKGMTCTLNFAGPYSRAKTIDCK
jgi:tripartite-type tricarboxylate transporter receptor subunit TctC